MIILYFLEPLYKRVINLILNKGGANTVAIVDSNIIECFLIPVTESVDISSGQFMNNLKNEIIAEIKKENVELIYDPPYKFNIYMDKKINSYVLEFQYMYLTKSQLDYSGIKSNGDLNRKFPKILKNLLRKYPTLKYKKNTSTLNMYIMYSIYSENNNQIKEENSLISEFTPENMDTCANKIMKDLRTAVSNVKKKNPNFDWGNPSYSFSRESNRDEKMVRVEVVNIAKDDNLPGTSKIINEIIKELKQMINKYYSNKSKVKIYYDSEGDSVTITLSYKL